MHEIIYSPNAPAPIGPYSQGVRVGNIVYLSGQIPLDPDTGDMVAGGAAEQTERVIENIKAALSAAGMGLENVVKTTCFLKSMGDFATFNGVYERHFVTKPARSCIGVGALPKDALVEIEVIAAL